MKNMLTVVVLWDGSVLTTEKTKKSIRLSDYRGEVQNILLYTGHDKKQVKTVEKLFDNVIIRKDEKETRNKLIKTVKGEVLIFVKSGSLLGSDLLSNIADSIDNGALAGTCLIKPKKKNIFILMGMGLNNLFKAEKNLQHLFFCSSKEYKSQKSRYDIKQNSKSKKAFKVVKSYVSV
jgi:hypothetical protein